MRQDGTRIPTNLAISTPEFCLASGVESKGRKHLWKKIIQWLFSFCDTPGSQKAPGPSTYTICMVCKSIIAQEGEMWPRAPPSQTGQCLALENLFVLFFRFSPFLEKKKISIFPWDSFTMQILQHWSAYANTEVTQPRQRLLGGKWLILQKTISPNALSFFHCLQMVAGHMLQGDRFPLAACASRCSCLSFSCFAGLLLAL
jgi:hypothetical protein